MVISGLDPSERFLLAGQAGVSLGATLRWLVNPYRGHRATQRQLEAAAERLGWLRRIEAARAQGTPPAGQDGAAAPASVKAT